jgi:hypothetical protein
MKIFGFIRSYLSYLVPHGASLADVTVKTSGFDTPQKYFVDVVHVKFAA